MTTLDNEKLENVSGGELLNQPRPGDYIIPKHKAPPFETLSFEELIGVFDLAKSRGDKAEKKHLRHVGSGFFKRWKELHPEEYVLHQAEVDALIDGKYL